MIQDKNIMITMFSTIPKCQYFPLSNSLPPDNPENYRQLFLLQPHCLPPRNVFWEDSIKQVLFFMVAYILLISCPFVKVKTKQKSKYLKRLHPHNGIKSGDNLGRKSGTVDLKILTSSYFQ